MSYHPKKVNKSSLPPAVAPRCSFLSLEVLGTRSAGYPILSPPILSAGQPRLSLVSTVHGPIRRILLAYPTPTTEFPWYRAVYRNLFSALPANTELVVLTKPMAVHDLRTLLDLAGRLDRTHIIEAPDHLHFLVWAQDPCLVAATPDGSTVLIQPFTFPRSADALLPDFVAAATGASLVQSPLLFAGGNVLVGDDFFFVGADYPAKTITLTRQFRHLTPPDGMDEAEFVRRLFSELSHDRKLIYIGANLSVPPPQKHSVRVNGETWTEELFLGAGVFQPIFHIDMFLSLAGRGSSGRYRVLVGSPSLADSILRRPPLLQALDPLFDKIAMSLESQGFEVIRNPLPLTYVDDPAARTRTWYFASSNNCLVEINGPGENTVWLPTYGQGDWLELNRTDDENKRIWENLGFTVHQLPDFHIFAQNLGGVHCMVKYLLR
jgi:hypothetical protein